MAVSIGTTAIFRYLAGDVQDMLRLIRQRGPISRLISALLPFVEHKDIGLYGRSQAAIRLLNFIDSAKQSKVTSNLVAGKVSSSSVSKHFRQ